MILMRTTSGCRDSAVCGGTVVYPADWSSLCVERFHSFSVMWEKEWHLRLQHVSVFGERDGPQHTTEYR